MGRPTSIPRVARQMSGLRLATPRRMRLDVDPNDWRRLSDTEQRRAGRPVRGVQLAWSPLGADVLVPSGWRSSPVDHADLHRVREALSRRLGLDTAVVPGLAWPHLALVRYVDGSLVVFGCDQLPLDVAQAEAGLPIGRIERYGRDARVRPWEGRVTGHTDAELLAAPEFQRGGARDAEGRVS